MNYPNLERLIEIIDILRSPGGCEWDREQTHATLKRNMLEEAYEAVDAINDNDMKHLREELGDVLLQVVLHAQIAKEEKAFDIEDVAKTLSDKLIHRHPHVFGNQKVSSTAEILDNWEKLKKEEKPHRTSVMDGISKAQSALMSAQKISKKAVKVGFEWPNEESLNDCVQSEIKEFKEAKTQEEKEEELGDILFAVVNLARWNKIDAEQALLKANKKFIARFRAMEAAAHKELEHLTLEEWDELWKKAKKSVKDSV
jgi:tetrapyrrole methylase family protein/MazG family protein